MDKRNRDEALRYTHRHLVEDAEVYASLALDYLDQARLQGDMALAQSIVADLGRVFRRSGLIWTGIEALLGEAALARLALNQARDRGFESAAARAERAAYYAWRSGRHDIEPLDISVFLCGRAPLAPGASSRLLYPLYPSYPLEEDRGDPR